MAGLTDEEMARLAAGQPAQQQGQQAQQAQPDTSGGLSDEQMAEIAQPESRGQEMVLNGLTFGLRPRIAAAWDTMSLSGDEYEKAKKSEWAKDDAYRAQNPWTSTALEIGGSLPTMFIPGLGAGRVAQAANSGVNAAQNLSRGARLARAVGVGRNVGSVGHEAGILGAKTAGLFGAGSSREDTIGGRLAEGASHAPLGYLAGRAGDALGRGVMGVGEHLYDAARVGGNAELGALTSMSRAMQRDNVTPQAIRNATLPAVAARGGAVPQDVVEAAVTTYGREIANGATDAAARRTAQQAYMQSARAAGVNGGASALRNQSNRAIDGYMQQMEIPLAVDEATRLVPGVSGQNSQWTRRTAASAPGEGKEQMFNAVTGRQEQLIPTARARVEDMLGDADVLGAKDRLVAANRQIEDQIYGAARAGEQPFDLTPALNAFNRTQPFSGGRTQELTQEALRIMRGTPDMATGQYPRHTLDSYIQARGQLNDLIESSMKVNPATGRSTPTSATRQLLDMKSQMDDIVGANNQAWRHANNTTRGLRSVEDAMDDGARVKLMGHDKHSQRTLRSVEDLRQRISTLEAMPRRTSIETAELALSRNRLEAYQRGFASDMHKQLDRMGDTHTVSKAFLKGGRNARSGPRRTLEIMMGRDEAEAFMQQMERANIASTTYKNQFNSQTTPLREAIDSEKETNRIAGLLRALAYIGRPTQIASDVGEVIGNRLYSDRSAAIARRLEATTENPQDFFALLRELEQFSMPRGRAFTSEGVNAYSAPGVLGAASQEPVSNYYEAQDEERKRRLRGY